MSVCQTACMVAHCLRSLEIPFDKYSTATLSWNNGQHVLNVFTIRLGLDFSLDCTAAVSMFLNL